MADLKAEIKQSAIIIWDTVLGLTLVDLETFSDGKDRSEDEDCENCAVTLVQLSGKWTGAIMIQCPVALAEIMAEIIFGEGCVDETYTKDVLGELVNMVAGNFKVVFEQPTTQGLPIVIFAKEYKMHLMGTETIVETVLYCEGYPLKVSLLEGDLDKGDAHVW